MSTDLYTTYVEEKNWISFKIAYHNYEPDNGLVLEGLPKYLVLFSPQSFGWSHNQKF